jgi:hypothetical protein
MSNQSAKDDAALAAQLQAEEDDAAMAARRGLPPPYPFSFIQGNRMYP